MILVVEDNFIVAKTFGGLIRKHIPDAEVSHVVDGENAFKALTYQDYDEFDPVSKTVHPRNRTKFVAVTWDNTMPLKWGEREQADVGLRTIEALRVSKLVDKAILGRFFSCSGDAPQPFIDSDYFVRVYSKPVRVHQIQELGNLFVEWNIAFPANGNSDERSKGEYSDDYKGSPSMHPANDGFANSSTEVSYVTDEEASIAEAEHSMAEFSLSDKQLPNLENDQ